MRLPLIPLASICFLSFAWALWGHFRREGAAPLGMRLLSLFSTASFAAFVRLVSSRAASPRDAAAEFLLLASIVLFWWAVAATRDRRLRLAHSPDSADALHQRGPYAHVRHPFYASYLLFWTGTAIAAGPPQWIAATILVAWYVTLARREETSLEAGALGVAYRDYRRRTGMLFPKVVRP